MTSGKKHKESTTEAPVDTGTPVEHFDGPARLREKAEELLRKTEILSLEDLTALSPEEIQRMFHELRVHQIELEMQNEELRRTQGELDAARARYVDLYDRAPVGYCTISESGLTLEVNLTTATLLGVTRGALVRQRLAGFVLPEDQDIYYHFRKQLFDTGEPQVCEIRLLRADKPPLWARLEATVTVADEGGAPVCHVMMSDISGSKQVEKELQESLAQTDVLANLLHHSSQPFAVGCPDGPLGLFNPAFEKLTGYTGDELRSLNWEKELTPPEWREMERGKLEELRRSGLPVRYEKEYIRKDGSRVPIELLVHLKTDAKGSPEYYYSFLSDITERKRAQAALLETLERLKLATDAANIGIWSWNFADDNLEWDDRMYALYGVPKAESETLVFYELWRSRVHPDDVEGVEASLLKARYNHTVYEDVFRIVVPDGPDRRLRHIHSAAIVEHDRTNGRPLRMIGIDRDITPQRDLEEDLRAAKEAAEAANAAKGRFLANMSHEIRTPMNVVIGLSQLLGDTDLSTLQRDYLNKIRNAATALLSILNDILDYSKIEAGQLEVESIPLRMDEVLGTARILFGALAEEKGLTLSFEITPNVPAVLQGDPLRLGQVIHNLVGNALKFTEHGSIQVKADCTPREGQWVLLRVSVRDTGIGLTPDQSSQLFVPFCQADASTTRKYGGTGLGLSISKRLVELMGGEIGVESVEGNGSIFWFTARLQRFMAQTAAQDLAYPREAGASRTEADMEAHDGWPDLARIASSIRGARVLVVDDSPTNLLIVRTYLEKMGLMVETAEKGCIGADKATDEHFDAVLMDLQMPEMDGFTAARVIRAHDACKTLPIIALTAAAMVSDRQACEAAGMNDHVPKPIDPIQLAHTLVKWIPARPVADTVANVVPPAMPQPPVTLPAPAAGLFTLPGLKLERAVQAFGKDGWVTLRRVLVGFHRDFAEAPEQLVEALNDRRFDVAIRLVHTIKGLAYTIGAESLYGLSQKLEKQLNEGSTVLLPEFQALLSQVLSAIAPLRHDAEKSAEAACSAQGTSQVPIDTAALLPKLEALMEMLATGQLQACRLNTDIESMLAGSPLQRPYAFIAELIDRLDYKTALDRLRAFAQQENRLSPMSTDEDASSPDS